MKKILLFLFTLFSIYANGQEFDEIYLRNKFVLRDSTVTHMFGDTLVNSSYVRNAVLVSNKWTDVTGGISYPSGNVTINDTLYSNNIILEGDIFKNYSVYNQDSTVYVSDLTGSDGNPGTEALPYKTIAYAIKMLPDFFTYNAYARIRLLGTGCSYNLSDFYVELRDYVPILFIVGDFVEVDVLENPIVDVTNQWKVDFDNSDVDSTDYEFKFLTSQDPNTFNYRTARPIHTNDDNYLISTPISQASLNANGGRIVTLADTLHWDVRASNLKNIYINALNIVVPDAVSRNYLSDCESLSFGTCYVTSDGESPSNLGVLMDFYSCSNIMLTYNFYYYECSYTSGEYIQFSQCIEPYVTSCYFRPVATICQGLDIRKTYGATVSNSIFYTMNGAIKTEGSVMSVGDLYCMNTEAVMVSEEQQMDYVTANLESEVEFRIDSLDYIWWASTPDNGGRFVHIPGMNVIEEGDGLIIDTIKTFGYSYINAETNQHVVLGSGPIQNMSYTFSNGLTESGGAVTWEGTLTKNSTINNEDTYYVKYSNPYNSNAFQISPDYIAGYYEAGSVYSNLNMDYNNFTLDLGDYTNNYYVYNDATASASNAVQYMSVMNPSSEEIKLSLHTADGIVITDDINNRGLENAADYSANSTARSLTDSAQVASMIGGVAQSQWVNISGGISYPSGSVTINDSLILLGETSQITSRLVSNGGNDILNFNSDTIRFGEEITLTSYARSHYSYSFLDSNEYNATTKLRYYPYFNQADLNYEDVAYFYGLSTQYNNYNANISSFQIGQNISMQNIMDTDSIKVNNYKGYNASTNTILKNGGIIYYPSFTQAYFKTNLSNGVASGAKMYTDNYTALRLEVLQGSNIDNRVTNAYGIHLTSNLTPTGLHYGIFEDFGDNVFTNKLTTLDTLEAPVIVLGDSSLTTAMQGDTIMTKEAADLLYSSTELSVGTSGQVPYVNPAGTDFIYPSSATLQLNYTTDNPHINFEAGDAPPSALEGDLWYAGGNTLDFYDGSKTHRLAAATNGDQYEIGISSGSGGVNFVPDFKYHNDTLKVSHLKADSNIYISGSIHTEDSLTIIADNNNILRITKDTSDFFRMVRMDSIPIIKEKIGSFAEKTTDTSLPSSTTPTIVIFQSESYDYGSNYNTSTGQYTIPYDGIYAVNASVNMAGVATGAQARSFIYVNGAEKIGSGPGYFNVSIVVASNLTTFFSQGDVVDIRCYQNSPSAGTIYGTERTRFFVTMIYRLN